MDFDDAINLCVERFQQSPLSVVPIRASGSSRKYIRLILNEFSVICCCSSNIRENETFVNLSRLLKEKNVPVPEIFAFSRNKECYLLQDLGDEDFLSFLHAGHDVTEKWIYIEKILENLVKFQSLQKSDWQDVVEFEPLGKDLIRYDLSYAENNLFKCSGVVYNHKKLSEDFLKLEQILLACPNNFWGLMFRDFQSRNIMMHDGPYFIDYQSARYGPGLYDLVSFAWQAKAGFSPEDRVRIIQIYKTKLSGQGKETNNIEEHIYYWALFRILQTLGAYGLRGLKEGKPHFIQSIPPALDNCNKILTKSLKNKFPELEIVIGSLMKVYPHA